MKTKALFFLVPALILWPLAARAAERICDIERVFMHLPGDYSVAYKGEENVINVERIAWDGDRNFWASGLVAPKINSAVAKQRAVLHDEYSFWTEVHRNVRQLLIADVPADKPMYVELAWDAMSFYVRIHIHSVADISGGEWSTGGKDHKEQQTAAVG